MKRIVGALVLAVVVMQWPTAARAQSTLGSQERERRRELEKREVLERSYLLEEEKTKRKMKELRKQMLAGEGILSRFFGVHVDLQFGGWVQGTYFTFSDEPDDPTTRTAYESDIRLWANLEFGDVHQLFARFRATYVSFKDDTSFRKQDDDWDGPRLDQAYYRVLLHDAAEKYFDRVLPFETALTVGRQFLALGSGLIYNRIEDAALVELAKDVWQAKVFVAKTVRHRRDIDPTKPVPSNSKRDFLGSQLTYEFKVVRAYLAYLHQRDQNEKEAPGQSFVYHSEYFVAGLGGPTYFLPDVLYRAEGVYQRGKSTATGSTTQEAIEAYAVLLTMRYTLPISGRPTLEGGYMFGSGDSDRDNVTATVTGNREGTRDHNFLYFGFVDTGLAFIPRVSNIHIATANLNIRPFHLLGVEKLVGYLKTGLRFYSYWKAERNGVVSDLRSDGRTDRFLGTEYDLVVEWQIFSDVAMRGDFGFFSPGSGIKEGEKWEKFVSVSLTYSF